MDFILRILFTGLIVFVPSEDRQEVTIFLLNVDHSHHLSDNTSLEEHKPLLLARAGSCTGDCTTDDADIAEYLFADQSATTALDSLEAAVTGGGAWQLAGSELSLRKGSSSAPELPSLVIRDDVRGSANGVPLMVPTSATERGDFSWIADLKELCTTGCSIDSSFFDEEPPAGLVAARFRLRTGNMFTYSVARIGSDVTPVHFKRLDGTGSDAPYSQAVAIWVGADVAVTGDSIEIVEEPFGGGTERTMNLVPDENDKVEIAVLNLPPFVPPATQFTGTPEVGKHFEMYYELGDTPPSPAARLVPRPGAASGSPSYTQVTWQSVHPQTELWSGLLNQIRLDVGRSMYEEILCPPAQDPRP